MITERQEKILNSLIKEYIDRAEPISSNLLQKKSNLDVSPATIRNDLQELTNKGYITQPHTSAGRVPTDKGYKYFIEITFSGKINKLPEFILKEVEEVKEKIERELEMARELEKSLEEISSALDFNKIEEDMLFDVLKIMGPSKITYKKNIDTMKELLKFFDNL